MGTAGKPISCPLPSSVFLPRYPITQGGVDSIGLGINNAGQVVGTSRLAPTLEHAFLYSNGQLRDLNDLVDPRAEPGAASMRRPLLSTENCLSPKKKGFTKGGLPLLWGSRRFFRRGGNPPSQASPGGSGRGSYVLVPISLFAHRRFTLLPSALLLERTSSVPVGFFV